MDDLTEEELLQIVGGQKDDWMSALRTQNPNWILQAIQAQPTSPESGEAGPIEGYAFYDPTKTSTSDRFKQYDPSGKLLGERQFKKPGNIWDLTKQATADLAPILSFTPLAPVVKAIGALSAAEQGNVLGALAAGLPLADKIPGLDKATAAALQNAGKYVSVASAAKSKNPIQFFNALAQTPEFGGKVPEELKTAGKYLSTANAVQQAAKGNIGALMQLIPGSAKSPTAGQAASAGYGGAETEGFFDAEKEGTPNKYYTGLENVFSDWDEADIIPDTYDTAPKTTMSPNDMAKFLEANIDDPGTIETIMQDLFPDLSRQTITTTAKKEEPGLTPGRTIRDVGPVTQIQPGEKLEGTDITEPDLAKDLPKVMGGTKTTTTKSGKPATQGGLDYQKLMAILALMQGKKPEKEEEQQAASPFPEYDDLMYGLTSRYA